MKIKKQSVGNSFFFKKLKIPRKETSLYHAF